MAERVPFTGVRYVDPLGQTSHMVALPLGERGIWVLGEDGASVWDGPERLRTYADMFELEMREEDPANTDVLDTIAAYRLLADLIVETSSNP